MTTNIPLIGNFKVTTEYKKKGNWAAGWHTGIDLVGNENIYSSCFGVVSDVGIDNSYGNYLVIKNDIDGRFHWFCHLSKINIKKGDRVQKGTLIGIMGSTGNSTGKHLHFEIRNPSNKYADTINPANYMGIPNIVGNYNSDNYQISNEKDPNELKILAKNTNLRSAPNINSSSTLYLANTTLYILQKNVANSNGYTWDKVKIKSNGKIGYMINQNYK